MGSCVGSTKNIPDSTTDLPKKKLTKIRFHHDDDSEESHTTTRPEDHIYGIKNGPQSTRSERDRDGGVEEEANEEKEEAERRSSKRKGKGSKKSKKQSRRIQTGKQPRKSSGDSQGGSEGATDEEETDIDAKYHYKDLKHASDRGGGKCGLRNLGNTCYMNAAVQCLSHTTALTEHLLSGVYEEEINTRNPLGSGGDLARAYSSLLHQLWQRPSKSGRYGSVAPKAFKKKISRFASQFGGYDQHDAQEFLAYLLDGLHEDLNRVKDKPYVEIKDSDGRSDETVAAESWFSHLKRNKSVIVDLFQGQLKSTLQCRVCSFTNIKFDPFMYLTLPIALGSSHILQDTNECLEAFTTRETLSGDECWRCSKCKEFVEAEKKFDLWKTPPILVVHLNRFKFSRRYKRVKVQDKVSFPLTGWDLRKHFPYAQHLHKVAPLYDLYAVANHHGTSEGGHYTSYCLDEGTGQWLHYNDDRLEVVEEEDVVSPAAYLLFYSQRRTKPVARQSLTVPHLWPHRMSAIPAEVLKEVTEVGRRPRLDPVTNGDD